MIDSYSNVAKVALRLLLPFVLTYLCESGFSTMLLIKTAHRNRLELEDDIRCALSEIFPRIDTLPRANNVKRLTELNLNKNVNNRFYIKLRLICHLLQITPQRPVP